MASRLQEITRALEGGTLNPEDFKALLRTREVGLLDVRTHEEVAEWPLPGAIHVPLDDLTHPPEGLPAESPVLAVCAEGRRSAQAAQRLADWGYASASLQGGMRALARTYDDATTPVGSADLVQVRRLGRGCLTHVIAFDGEALVVDATCHLEHVLGLVRARGWHVRHVLDTHRHADHLSGAGELARATGARLHLSSEDGYDIRAQEAMEPGTQFELGPRQEVVVDTVATPGHTPGSITLHVEDALLTGDTLFLDGHARPDLRDEPEALARALHRTYRRIAGWDPRLRVFPSHLSAEWPLALGRVSSDELGAIRARLDVFGLEEERFMERVLDNLPPKPSNHLRILDLNRHPHATCSEAEVEALETGGNRCVA